MAAPASRGAPGGRSAPPRGSEPRAPDGRGAPEADGHGAGCARGAGRGGRGEPAPLRAGHDGHPGRAPRRDRYLSGARPFPGM